MPSPRPSVSTAPAVKADVGQPVAAPTMLGDLAVEPITIGHFIVLQEIDSPLLPGKAAPISMKDVAMAVFILTDGRAAHEALRADRAEFEKQAFTVAMRVPAADLAKVAALLAGARPA